MLTPVMEEIKCKRVNGGETLDLPLNATIGSAGLDLRANIQTDITIKPGERLLVPTGIALELEAGQLCFVVPRSGLANKFGISIVNSPGTVDSDYRGEIHVNLINLGQYDFNIQRGNKIAQMIIMSYIPAKLVEVDELSETERGENGHGSTGVI